jgi:hypothetical protein
MDDDVFRRYVALRLLAVADDERVVDVVVVAPPPSLNALESLQLRLVGLLLTRSGKDVLRRFTRRRRRGGLAESLSGTAVENAEARDERSLAGRAVRTETGVLAVAEEGNGRDVVRGGPAGELTIIGGVAGTSAELGNAAR